MKIPEIIFFENISQYGIKVAITTTVFGNMRIKDLTKYDLLLKLTKLRSVTNFTGKIISPVPGLGNAIFDSQATNDILECTSGFDRTNQKYDGATFGGDSSYTGYLLANADCPIGIFVGRKNGKAVVTTIGIHLALQCLQKRILKNALAIAKQKMDSIDAFFFGYGIGPDMYQFSVSHPTYGVQNKEILDWIRSLGVVVVVDKKGNFPIDLFAITEKILRQAGYNGLVIREEEHPCTASAQVEGKFIFHSNARDRGKDTQLYRNGILVGIL